MTALAPTTDSNAKHSSVRPSIIWSMTKSSRSHPRQEDSSKLEVPALSNRRRSIGFLQDRDNLVDLTRFRGRFCA
jgi:hypothetical protein